MKNPTFYSVIDIEWYILKNIKIFQKRLTYNSYMI